MKKIFLMFVALATLCMACTKDKDKDEAEPAVKVTGVSVVDGSGVAVESVNLAEGATYQIVVKVLPADAADKTVSYSSADEAIATVSETGLVTAVSEGTTVITITTKDGGFHAELTITVTATHYVDMEYIDLGLTSGTLWAVRNIGALDIAEQGDHFYWGYVPVPEQYTEENFMELTGNAVHGSIEGSQYDAATAILGLDWQLPTPAQWQELLDECTWQAVNGGYSLTSNSNPNATLFLPYTYNADYRGLLDASYTGHHWGCYWSSQEDETNQVKAHYMYFNQYDVLFVDNPMYGTSDKWAGMTIRAVRK